MGGKIELQPNEDNESLPTRSFQSLPVSYNPFQSFIRHSDITQCNGTYRAYVGPLDSVRKYGYTGGLGILGLGAYRSFCLPDNSPNPKVQTRRIWEPTPSLSVSDGDRSGPVEGPRTSPDLVFNSIQVGTLGMTRTRYLAGLHYLPK